MATQREVEQLEWERNQLRDKLKNIYGMAGGLLVLIRDTMDELEALKANLENFQREVDPK